MSQQKGDETSNSDAIACEYYDQCLGFEDVNTVFALCTGILMIVIFLFIASIWHRRSNLEHLQFITSNFYLYFYLISMINFILILLSVKFLNDQSYSQGLVGITLILTSIATMLVNIIGCKYYRSYMLMKKCRLRLLKFIGVSSMIIFTIIGCGLLYFIQFDHRKQVKIQFDWFLAYMLMAGVIHTSIASLASKLAQIGWIILMIFAVLYVESYWNERYSFNLFLIYWHPIVLCAISVAAVFFFSPFSQLRRIALGIFSCFIAMFDLVTDVNVISVWISKGHYVWASFQMLFILSGVIFSGYYVKDYYGFVKVEQEAASPKEQEMKPVDNAQVRKQSYDHNDDSIINAQDSMISGQTTTEILKGGDEDDEVVRKQSSYAYSQKTFSEYIPSKKMQIIGQVFTFIGLGRLWHSILGWDSQQNKDMMIANRILKIWEMIFESMPTLVLQFYILLLEEQEYDLSVMLSMSASAISVTFTLLRVLYGDHHSMSREQDLNVGLLRLKNKKSDDMGQLQFSHRNVLKLTMMGHSPAEIADAWDQVKQTEEHEFMQQDDPEFADIMQRQLEKNLSIPPEPQPSPHSVEEQKQPNSPSRPSMNAPRPEYTMYDTNKIPLYIQISRNDHTRSTPTIPSMNIPRPMISVNINGQDQGQYVPPAGAVAISAQGAAIVQQQTAHQQPQFPQPPMMNYQSAPMQPMQPMPMQQGVYGQPPMVMAASNPMNPMQYAQPQPPMANMNGNIQYTQPSIRGGGTINSVSIPFERGDTALSDHTVAFGAVDQMSVSLQAPNGNYNGQRKHFKAVSVHSEATSERADSDYAGSEFGGSVAPSIAASDISYKNKKNRIDWNHPHVFYLKDDGWSKNQIREAWYLLKNNSEHPDSKERQKLREDNDKFVAWMTYILENELEYKREHKRRQFNENSECINTLYQNWICCVCLRICTKIRKKELDWDEDEKGMSNSSSFCCFLRNPEKQKAKSNQDFTMQDNIFYFGIYVFVMSDFYCRIFPLLAYTVLLHKYFATLTKFPLLNVFTGAFPAGCIIFLFELLCYYMMLKRKAKTFKMAIKYFWTGTYTISYYLLSTMHLTYLPSNVRFVRMYRAHLIRMGIQLIFMCIAIGMQYELFDSPLGFFNRSVFFFGFNLILNLMILVWIKCYMTVFEKKLNYNLSTKH